MWKLSEIIVHENVRDENSVKKQIQLTKEEQVL